MSELHGYQRFFAELKRRRVFRVAAVYGATAFVVVQAADVLQEALLLPGAFLTGVAVLALLGFPIAIVLAWAYERTSEGVVRTDAATTHLAVTGDVGCEKRRDIQKRVLELLAENSVLTRAKLREVLSVKNERLGEALESLQQAGRISRTPIGWQRTH